LAYVTATLVYADRLSRLTTTVASASIVSSYIAKAESIIDGYAARRYTLPFTDTPPLVTELAKDLTICYTLMDGYTQDNNNRNAWVGDKLKDIYETLERVGNGSIQLVHSNTMLTLNVATNMKSSMLGVPLIANMDDERDWSLSETLTSILDEFRER